MNVLEDKDNYTIGGRYIEHQGILYLSYSASYIEFRVRATKVAATLCSKGYANDESYCGCVFVFINDCEKIARHIAVEKGKHEYVLYENEAEDDVTIRLMKSSETAFGEVGIEQIKVDGEILTPKSCDKPLIEFVGDSITCGYGFHGKAGIDEFKTMHENPWDNYAGKTARTLNCNYQLICWSGNGVLFQNMNYPKEVTKSVVPYIQDMYLYSDIQFERKRNVSLFTQWQFERKPQIVVINVGTNDSVYTKQDKEKEMMFAKKYEQLLEVIRAHNEDAHIICSLGMMEQSLSGIISEIVDRRSFSGDSKIHFLQFDEQLEVDGYGTDFHPSEITHQKAADKLVRFIKDRLRIIK